MFASLVYERKFNESIEQHVYWCLNFIGAIFIKKWCNFLLVPEFNKIHKTNAFIGASFLLVLNLLENGAISC